MPISPLNKKQGRSPCYQIGIDLGGTKTEIILLKNYQEELFRKRIPTPVDARDNYKTVIKNIDSLVHGAISNIGTREDISVGIGIPGIMDKNSGVILNANTKWLVGRNFKQDIENTLGKTIAMENDANCFVLAETINGAAKGNRVVFGIILGTGCGGGLCINNEIHTGKNGIAGEWGHFSIDPEGEKCFCGNRGCIETKLSGPSLSRKYKLITNQSLPAEIIVQKARKKEPAANKVFTLFLDDFGKAVGGLISLLDPDVVVLGGGLSNIPEIYTAGLEKIRKYAFHPQIRTRLFQNTLGDSAGVYGAAWLNCHNTTH